jgi:brefeldin A-resistance guanine nucleotide exchange factor 1
MLRRSQRLRVSKRLAHWLERGGLIDLSIQTAWKVFWLPLLLTIAKHSVNGSRDIRQRAIGYLQRVLLSSQVVPTQEHDVALISIFSRVLFPVVDELLKPQIYNQDPPSMEETRLRASALLCKAFLQYLVPLSERPDRLVEIFLKTVDLMERFMRTGSRQQVSLNRF